VRGHYYEYPSIDGARGEICCYTRSFAYAGGAMVDLHIRSTASSCRVERVTVNVLNRQKPNVMNIQASERPASHLFYVARLRRPLVNRAEGIYFWTQDGRHAGRGTGDAFAQGQRSGSVLMVDPSPPLPHVRLVVAEDAKLIHAGLLTIAKYLGSEERVTSTPDDIRRHGFGAQQAFTVLIAEIEGAFAGMCLFFQSFSTWRGQKGAYIQDIVVEERFRGAGVGVALLRHTAAHIRASGGTYLRLSVDAKNVPAQHFYERMGLSWAEDERIHAAYGDAFEALAGLHESGV